MAKRYLVTLSEDERAHLLAVTKKGKVAARKLTRAHILLQADAGVLDMAIATALHVGTATVERIRKRFVEEGLEAALGQGEVDGDEAVVDLADAAEVLPLHAGGHVALLDG